MTVVERNIISRFRYSVTLEMFLPADVDDLSFLTDSYNRDRRKLIIIRTSNFCKNMDDKYLLNREVQLHLPSNL